MVEPVSPKTQLAYERLHATAEFAELKRAYLAFVRPVTIGFILWYVLYVVCSNWAPGFMGTKLVGNINVALVFGALQFVTTFLIAWAYQRYSVAKLDTLANGLRAEFDQEVAR